MPRNTLITWKGGPLDGCEDTGPAWPILWYGPDVSDPLHKVVVYALRWTEEAGSFYEFSQDLTDKANQLLSEKEE